MAMQGGFVAVDDNEQVSGGGLARAIFDRQRVTHGDQLAQVDAAYDGLIQRVQAGELGATSDESKALLTERFQQEKTAARLNLLRQWASTANDLGPPIVAYIQAEARVSLDAVKATVSPTTSTGRTPNPNTPDTAIQGPAAAVSLPVTGAGGATSLGVA